MAVRKNRRRYVARMRRARVWYRRRKAVERFIDGAFITLLFGYELPHNSRWILFAELFWTDCPICFWYRGAVFGFFLAAIPAIATGAILWLN